MREYSDNVSSEFAELCKRADSGDKIKLFIYTSRGDYTLEGNVSGIHLCSLIVKNSVLDLSKIEDENLKDYFRNFKEGTAHVPLGDYIKNYEFLTGKEFTIEQQKEERKNYYDILKKKSKDPHSYLDFIYD